MIMGFENAHAVIRLAALPDFRPPAMTKEEPWPVWTPPDCPECGAVMERLGFGVAGWRCPTKGCKWGRP